MIEVNAESGTITRSALGAFLAETLGVASYPDYGPNGLQVEGRESIRRVGFAVSATRDSILRAADAQADALIVHHGLLWNFSGPRPLVGAYARRVFPLIHNGINLFAYHLPLDAHPMLGNAAGLARALGFTQLSPFGDYKGKPTGVQGVFEDAPSASSLKEKIAQVLKHSVLFSSPDETAQVRTLGVITGGANRDWSLAHSAGLDGYLTGEMSEHDWHESQEAGIHMYAGGHHATEVFGVQSLMTLLSERFGLDCFYIDSENPA